MCRLNRAGGKGFDMMGRTSWFAEEEMEGGGGV